MFHAATEGWAMPKVEISRATAAERPTLRNLMQLYVHDFSEFWAGTPDGDLQPDGRFGDYDLAPYWSAQYHFPLLVRASGQLVGFALVDDAGHSGQPTDWNVAEFFIARKYRRGGFGTAAAHGLFNRYPGQWEAAVARKNTGALPFWRGAVASHPRVSDIQEDDVTSPAWNGQILRFRIAAA
jgi:predicted acetyltransferase